VSNNSSSPSNNLSDASADAKSSRDADAPNPNKNNTADNPVRAAAAAVSEQVQEVSDTMNEKISDLGAAAKRAGEKARDFAREQGDKAREYAREQGEKAREYAREQYEVRSEQVRRGYSQAKETAGEWSDDLTDYVRENPGRSLLAAAGVGFLIGLLVRGVRRD